MQFLGSLNKAGYFVCSIKEPEKGKTLCPIVLFISFEMFKIDFPIRSRNKQDENVTGISKSAKVLRKRRNLVSIQFNLINWLLETVSLILVLGDNFFLKIISLMLSSCGTPLVILFHLVIFLLKSYFYRSTFWVLRKTGGWPGSTSSRA